MPLGRQAELGVLTRVLDDIATDRASVVVVQGEAGQGKTALLDWAAGAARGRGFEVLRVTGIEFERGLAFSGLTAVLRPLLHRLDDLTDVQAQALRGALGLERSEAPVLTVYAATLSLLSLGADASPVLVVVDDAHWIDPSSLEALVFAAHRCDADRVGFAFAQRSGVHCALDQTRFARIDLGGLDRDAAVALLSDAGVVALVAVRCWNLTNGNPLALIEGARGLSPAQRRGEAPCRRCCPSTTGCSTSTAPGSPDWPRSRCAPWGSRPWRRTTTSASSPPPWPTSAEGPTTWARPSTAASSPWRAAGCGGGIRCCGAPSTRRWRPASAATCTGRCRRRQPPPVATIVPCGTSPRV
jgi:hypothetical protein